MSPGIQRLGFLGCGHMGRAILRGVLNKGDRTALKGCKYEVSVTNSASAQRLQSEFASHKEHVKISSNANLETAKNSDVVLLCFPPGGVKSVLGEKGMGDALDGKLIISLLAGISRDQMAEELASSASNGGSWATDRAQIARVNPTLGTQADESATIIAIDDPPISEESMNLTKLIFEQIGDTYATPGHLLDPVMAMGTVCHALMAVAADALVDGSAVAGIPREHAIKYIGQCFRGYATLIARGEEPAELKKSLMIPYGFTARSILNLERRGVRSALSDAVVDIVADTRKKS